MDKALWRAYRAADYRIRRASGGYASIRIDQPLPPSLYPLLHSEHESWIVITAWHPRSRRRPRALNRLAQRDLRRALSAAGARYLCAAIGIGGDGWREPSLFVSGLTPSAQHALMRRFDQYAIVYGHGYGRARLRLNKDRGGRTHKSPSV